MASKEMFRLLNVLDQRDIALGREDIAWAFEDSSTKQQAEQWVTECLNPASLLTKEELAFAKSKSVSSTESLGDANRPISDTEYRAAISSLEASTAAIEKQCELLESQKRALQRLRTRDHHNTDTADAPRYRQQKLARDKAQVDLEVHEVDLSIGEKIQTARKQSDTDLGSLVSQTERLLEKDDRLLDGLQKLTPKLSSQSSDHTSMREIDKLCQTLTSLLSEHIRLKVDNAYTTTLTDRKSQANGHSEEQSEAIARERDAVRAEFEELNGEIAGLLTLTVNNQYRVPLAKSIESSRSALDAERAQWSDYLVAMLQYLSSRLDTLSEHSQHLQAHSTALKAISAALQEIQEQHEQRLKRISALKAAPSATATAAAAAAATASKRQSKGLRPLMLVNRSQENIDPTGQLLRQLDVRNADPSDHEKFVKALQTTVQERVKRNAALVASTEDATTRQLAASLQKSDRDLQHLMAAVYEHSPFAKVNLVDKEVQDSVRALEEKTDELAEQMRALDGDAIARELKAKQKMLLEAWK